MQFVLDHCVIFTKNVKQTRLVVQQISCQMDKWLWSYELIQQLFCSLGIHFLFLNFF
jgi:hypothetical protein